MTNAVIFLSRTVSAQQFLWELYFVWGQLGNFVFGNSSRQILSLHSVSVTSSSLRLLPGCRCNSLPPIFHQDRCSSSCLNLWSITLHPSSLTLKGIIIIQETFLEFHHNHPTHPLPPSSSSLGLWQKPPEVFGASKSFKDCQPLCHLLPPTTVPPDWITSSLLGFCFNSITSW